jgi:predicted phage-related endonuclease
MRTWTQIQKESHGSQAWLNQRFANASGEKQVSASVAAAIYDKHPFTSAAAYAAELLREQPPVPQEQNEAMERGNRLESVLLDWANDKLGSNFVVPDVLYVFSDNNARMIATLDGFDGERILEIKTTTRDWTGELPEYWAVQGIHQAVCANVSEVIWAVFDRSQTLNLYTQFVSSDEKETHINACAQWLSYIDMGMTPDGVAWTYETIQARHPEDDGGLVELGPKGAELVAQLKHIKSELKSYEAMEDACKAELCELIGDAATAVVAGEVVATWKTSKRSSLDTKALKEAHPDLVASYTKEVPVRTLRLKGAN